MEWQPQSPALGEESEIDLPPEFPAPEPEPRAEGWGYVDIVIFLAFAVISLLFASAIGAAVFFGWTIAVGADFSLESAQEQSAFLVGTQVLWSLALIAFIYLVVTRKYGLDFADAVAWKAPERPPIFYLSTGVLLAFAVMLVASVIPMPEGELPMEALLKNQTSVILLTIYGVLIAPPCEELIFRGYLFPAVERANGVAAAILGTSLFFSMLHAPQYGGHWQNLTLLFGVSVVFGIVRARTGSVLTTTLMHAAYNLTLFSGVLLGREHLDQI